MPSDALPTAGLTVGEEMRNLQISYGSSPYYLVGASGEGSPQGSPQVSPKKALIFSRMLREFSSIIFFSCLPLALSCSCSSLRLAKISLKE
jgi:hypothetical protein